MRRLVAGLGAAAMLMLTAWPVNAAQKDVSIQNIAFNPSTVTINVNDSVKWTNNELATDHNVFSDETQQLRSAETLDPGDTYTFTFGAAGTYNYYCTIHGKNQMSGQVIVQAAPTTTVTTRAPATTMRPVATTRAPAATTSSRATTSSIDTSTTSTLALETSTTEESTTTTSGDIAINTDDGGGTSGLAIAGLVVAILAVLGGGGYAIYRLRAGDAA